MAALPRLHLAHSSSVNEEAVDDETFKLETTGSRLQDHSTNKMLATEAANAESRRRFDELPRRSDYVGEIELKRDLRFFFMDPIEKWHAKRRFPWKLSFQFLKIFIVTFQLVMFGDMRMSHVEFVDQTSTTLKHIMIQNWEAGRDVRTYPPNFPDYSIYTVTAFYDHLTYAVQKYYALNETTFSTWIYDYQLKNDSQVPPLTLCVTQFKRVSVNLHNDSYYFDTTEIETCSLLDIPISDLRTDNFSMQTFLRDNNITIDNHRMIRAALQFSLKTVHVRKKQPTNVPDCFMMAVAMVFDNRAQSGQIFVDIESSVVHLACNGAYYYSDIPELYKDAVFMLDLFVLLICLLSLVLCLRALIRAQSLKLRTKQYFLTVHEVKLTKDEEIMFLNFWYVLIVANDICLIVGTICKFTIEYKVIGSALFTFTGMSLGVGTLFVWIGVLRYFGFFSHYNILILTLKKGFPNVLRFMVCAGLLYMGFLFCGWVVLGPYHMKFRDLQTASACLFALINGDDMFATFTTTSELSQPVVWFARIYLYIFISLFIYIVLSLFISIIMDAYEVVKDRYQFAEEDSYLKEFISRCSDASFTVEKPCCTCTGFWMSLKRRIIKRNSSNISDDRRPINSSDSNVSVET